jgi:hypothetical protein
MDTTTLDLDTARSILGPGYEIRPIPTHRPNRRLVYMVWVTVPRGIVVDHDLVESAILDSVKPEQNDLSYEGSRYPEPEDGPLGSMVFVFRGPIIPSRGPINFDEWE